MGRSLSLTRDTACPLQVSESEIVAVKPSVSSGRVIQKPRGVRACLITAIPLSVMLGTSCPAMATDGPLLSAPFLSFDVGSDPAALAIGDLNGDGRDDVVTSDFMGGTLSVVLENGDGTLGPKTSYPAGNNPGPVAIGDLNSDGKPDLVFATRFAPGAFSVLLGNGDGTFAPKVDHPIQDGSHSVKIADLNGDTKLDLAISNNAHGTVSVFLGMGNGDFEPGTDYDAGSNPGQVASADVNGDGKPDLVMPHSGSPPDFSGMLSVLLGNGDGSFGPRTDLATGNFAVSVAIGDLDGDGKPDLVAASSGAPSFAGLVSVFLGNGDGSFGPRNDYATGFAAQSVAAADLNRDGKLDVAVVINDVSSSSRSEVGVFLGNGNGTLGPRNDFLAAPFPHTLAVGNLNADGIPDIVVGTGYANYQIIGALSVLLGNGDGTFGGTQNYETGPNPRAVAIADLNHDGRADLAVASGNGVSILLKEDAGTFGSKTDYETGTSPSALAIGDLNGDQEPDLVVANLQSNTLSVLLGHADGTFGAKRDYVTRNAPSSIVIGDVNGDGKPDLAVGNGGSDQENYVGAVSVFLGNGDGTFGPRVDIATGRQGLSLATKDLDGDGKQDVIFTSIGDATVNVMLGNGDGTFAAPHAYETIYGPTAVAIGDLNRDGKPDLAVAAYEGTSILLGNGDGTFGPRTDYPMLSGSYGAFSNIVIGDLNSDGKPDLAIGNYGLLASGCNRTITVLLGRGDGTFQHDIDYGTGGRVTSVALGDLNGDHRLDLAAVGPCSNEVWVLLNIGPVVTNAAPDCSRAGATAPALWPPDHQMSPVTIEGVKDPDDDPVTIHVTGVTQDEPVGDRGAGDTSPDARIVNGQAQVRAERAGTGNGRVYRISFRAEDGRGGHCDGAVTVCVPHDQRPGHACVDDGQKYNSLGSSARASLGNVPHETAATRVSLWVMASSGGQAMLEYSLPADGEVSLAVYDVTGRRVAMLLNGRQTAGVHQVRWDAGGIGAGMYFYRLRAGETIVGKVGLLMK